MLNIASISDEIENKDILGPGHRFVIWVQGCPFSCLNCVSPNWIEQKDANLIAPDKLAKIIIENKSITGITISGGEPMLQAKALYELLDFVTKVRNDLNIIIFSGYKIEKLKNRYQQKLLTKVDLLIDGLYIEDKNQDEGLRGSSNQSFHYLTDKLIPFKSEIEEKKRNITVLDRQDEILLIGIPSKKISNILI